MAEKKTFLMYKMWLPMIDTMPDKSIANLMRAVSAYQQGKEHSLTDPMETAVFQMFVDAFEKDSEKYAETCERNGKNGKRGGRPKENPLEPTGFLSDETEQTKPTGFDSNRLKAKKADNDNDSDNDLLKDKNHCPADVSKIVDHLNLKTGAHYLSSSEKTRSLIKARLREGFKVEDFYTVIDKKVAEWKETDMAKYLRPETLFGTKFEGYLNQSVKPRAAPVTTNVFTNFEQRDYDYDALERALLKRGSG